MCLFSGLGDDTGTNKFFQMEQVSGIHVVRTSDTTNQKGNLLSTTEEEFGVIHRTCAPLFLIYQSPTRIRTTIPSNS
jgi:hypothetical protein